jgi:hypothetical protein
MFDKSNGNQSSYVNQNDLGNSGGLNQGFHIYVSWRGLLINTPVVGRIKLSSEAFERESYLESAAYFAVAITEAYGIGYAIRAALTARASTAVVISVERFLQSFDDIVKCPKTLWGQSADDVGSMLGDGWTKGVYGSKGTGWKFTKGDKSVFYHPGGGRHGGAYYGYSSAKYGKNKIVGNDYIPIIGDKSNIIKMGK